MERKLAAILAADVVGYSQMMARDEVLRLNPNFTIGGIRVIQPFRHESDFEVIAEGLRKAGLPD